MKKVKAIKDGGGSLVDIDLSDYAEFKLNESNIGYQMLKRAGWEEGKGLGADGQGITVPVNKYEISRVWEIIKIILSFLPCTVAYVN